MFPKHFDKIIFLQKKKDLRVYRAMEGSRTYILKCFPPESPAACRAAEDEYESLCRLSHPSIPAYFGLQMMEGLPEAPGPMLVLCMEHCQGIPLSRIQDRLDRSQLLGILVLAGELLHFLLNHGILYTDLNPDNLLVNEEETRLRVVLLDFTYCYYFLKNPEPEYGLRFSYDLDPSLKGQQLLIQELSLLTSHLLEENAFGQEEDRNSRLYALLETGAHPPDSLSLADYLKALSELC